MKKQKLFIASLRNRESSAGRRTTKHRTCLLHEEMTQKRISTVWDKWPPKKKTEQNKNYLIPSLLERWGQKNPLQIRNYLRQTIG